MNRTGWRAALRAMLAAVSAVAALGVASVAHAIVPGNHFLSDLPWVRASAGQGPVERDRVFGAASGGSPDLIVNGQRYAKGLGTFPYSEIVYALGGQCNEFRAVVGINDTYRGSPAGNRGSVIFRVWLDGYLRFDSGIVRGDSPALPVQLDVTGVREIRLETGASGDGVEFDAADWADARLRCGAGDTAVPVVNGSMEGAYAALPRHPRVTGNVAPGWSDNSTWADVTVRYTEDTATPRSGRTAQVIDVSDVRAGEMQFTQSVDVVAGRQYTPTVWLKGTPGMRVSVALQRGGPPWNRYSDATVELTADWRQVALPGFVDETVNAMLLITASRPGRIFIDDFTLRSSDASASPLPPVGTLTTQQFGMHVNNLVDAEIRNPGLEAPYRAVASPRATITGQTAIWWQDNSEWADVTVHYSQDTVAPHSGLSSQKIDIRAIRSGGVQFLRAQSLKPGRTYTFGAWLRGTPGMTVQLVLRLAPEPYTDYGVKDVTLTGDWQQVSVTGTITGTREAMLMVRTYTPGTFWIDDVTLTGDTAQWAWPAVPIGTLRLWDSATTWALLEPTKGVFDFSLLDQYVREAEQRRTQIILTLGQTPGWASARPGDSNYYGGGAAAEPANIQDWRNYVTAVVRRYRGRIQFYEVWNEPNDPTFYTGSVAKMVELARETQIIVKTNDPAARVISPSPYNVGWLDDFLARGGGFYADIIGYHHYATPPENMIGIFASVRQTMRARGVPLSKPLWHTEAAAGNTTTSEALGVTYLARMYLTSFLSGASRYAWYAWGPASPFCAATTGPDGVTANRTGQALGILQQWLVGGRILSATRDATQTWTLHLRMPDGTRGWILWNADAAVSFTLPADWQVSSRTDLFGAQSPISGVTVVQVSGSPMLLRSALR